MNEYEENLNEKKKKFKYEIRLADEHKQLENIENLDPSNIEIDIIEKAGINLPKNTTENEVYERLKNDLKKKSVASEKA